MISCIRILLCISYKKKKVEIEKVSLSTYLETFLDVSGLLETKHLLFLA